MKNDYYVYVYFDPRNNLPFYVGMGRQNRYLDHLRLAETILEEDIADKNLRRLYKINSIRRDGYEPVIYKFAQNLNRDQAFAIESIFIESWGRKDFDEGGILYNILEPGRKSPCITGSDHYNYGKRGAMTGRKLTDLQIERLRKAKLGKKREPFHTDEYKRQKSLQMLGENNVMYGKRHSEDTKNKMSQKAKIRKHSGNTRQKITDSLQLSALSRAEKHRPIIEDLISQGFTSTTQISEQLRIQDYKTERGGYFDRNRVRRLMKYLNINNNRNS